MISFRSPKVEAQYREYLHDNADGVCALCTKSASQSFAHWKIISNDFPYDLIAETHHMLAPIRHTVESGLNEDELREFAKIKESVVHLGYHYIIEATNKEKTIPEHFHLHLIVRRGR